jgi:hypothetical protein
MHLNPNEDHLHDQSSERLVLMLFITVDRSLIQGEQIREAEVTFTFFAMTEPFQFKDVRGAKGRDSPHREDLSS